MRAVNARLDLSRVSVFHAVGTRRGVHRARGSLCASLRRHGVDRGNKLVGQRTDQLARHSRRELQARPRKKCSSECLSAQPRAFIRWRPQSGARLPPRRNRHSETRAPTSARGDPPEAPDADLDPVDECAPFSPDGNVATVIYSHIADVQTRGALAMASRSWRDVSMLPASLPRRLDLDGLSKSQIDRLLDVDELTSLDEERMLELAGVDK